MSDNRALLIDLADRLFADLAGQGFDRTAPALAEAGFASLLVPAERGGFGGDWGDFAAVLRLAGNHALAAPLAEAVLARAVLDHAGLEAPDGLVLLSVPGLRVAHGREAMALVHCAPGSVALHPVGTFDLTPGVSPADEPADAVRLTSAPVAQAACSIDAAGLLAFARVAQGAGALGGAFALTLDHVNTRVQFGRTLGKFQAVQQAMAEFSEEAAAVDAAAAGAAAALDWAGLTGDCTLEIAAARVRLGLAIDRAVPIAHRLHGAIGFTRDHALNHLTRRLMGWRSDTGNDATWAARLGRIAAQAGGAGLWAMVTERGDAQSMTQRQRGA